MGCLLCVNINQETTRTRMKLRIIRTWTISFHIFKWLLFFFSSSSSCCSFSCTNSRHFVTRSGCRRFNWLCPRLNIVFKIKYVRRKRGGGKRNTRDSRESRAALTVWKGTKNGTAWLIEKKLLPRLWIIIKEKKKRTWSKRVTPSSKCWTSIKLQSKRMKWFKGHCDVSLPFVHAQNKGCGRSYTPKYLVFPFPSSSNHLLFIYLLFSCVRSFVLFFLFNGFVF